MYMIRASDEWAEKGGHSEEERRRHFSRILGTRCGADEPAQAATDDEIEKVARNFYWYLMKRDISNFSAENLPRSHL